MFATDRHRQARQSIGKSLDVFDAVRHIRCELDDFDDPPLEVENRIIGCLNVDVAAAFANAHKLVGDELSSVELAPHLCVVRACRKSWINEHAVMLAHNLRGRVAKRLQEVLVRRKDRAVRLKLDHRLRS